jgi:hypothetical protein
LSKIWVLAVAVVMLTGCAGNNGNTSRPDADGGPLTADQRNARQAGVKVAMLLPLTADASTGKLAKAMKQAGELALFEREDTNVRLILRDTGGTPEGARKAAEFAVSSGAELIIGPLFASSVKTVAPIARKAGVPVLTFSSDRSVAGGGVYLMSFLTGSDVDRIVAYAISQNRKRFAAIIPDSRYGRLVEAEFRKSLQYHGGELLALEHFPANANGMLEPVQRISMLAQTVEEELIVPQIDVLFIPAGPKLLPSLAPILPYYSVDTDTVKVIGTGRWDFTGIGRQKALLGSWFPATDPARWKQFAAGYADTYNEPPPKMASLSYDAISLATSLSGNPKARRFSAGQLTRQSGFSGINGLFRLLPDGTSERGFAILEVGKFGPQVIDPMPGAF